MRFAVRRSLTFLALLASCSAGGSYKDLAEPVTLEDLQPLPAQVTRENAAQVVRKGLQLHRRFNDLPDEEFGYVFRDGGFVQIHHLTPQDRAEERVVRTFIDFQGISSVTAEPYFDFQRIKERFRVTLTGNFRVWEAPVRAFRHQPEIGAEPSTRDLGALVLALDEAFVAKQISVAFVLLSKR